MNEFKQQLRVFVPLCALTILKIDFHDWVVAMLHMDTTIPAETFEAVLESSPSLVNIRRIDGTYWAVVILPLEAIPESIRSGIITPAEEREELLR